MEEGEIPGFPKRNGKECLARCLLQRVKKSGVALTKRRGGGGGPTILISGKKNSEKNHGGRGLKEKVSNLASLHIKSGGTQTHGRRALELL